MSDLERLESFVEATFSMNDRDDCRGILAQTLLVATTGRESLLDYIELKLIEYERDYTNWVETGTRR